MKVDSSRAENGIQFLLEADEKFGMESCACEKVFREKRVGGKEQI